MASKNKKNEKLSLADQLENTPFVLSWPDWEMKEGSVLFHGKLPEDLHEKLLLLAETLIERAKHIATFYSVYPLRDGYCRIAFAFRDKPPKANIISSPRRKETVEFIEEQLSEKNKEMVLNFTHGIWDMGLLSAKIRIEFGIQEPSNLKWDEILNLIRAANLINKNPNDRITIPIAVRRFHVSRSTLQRAIQQGTIKTYRSDKASKRSRHLLSENEIASIYERR